MQLRPIALGHRSAERGVGLPSGVLSAVLGVGGAHRVVHRLERREHEHVARAFAHVELAHESCQSLYISSSTNGSEPDTTMKSLCSIQ
jgi:hypothetical protein